MKKYLKITLLVVIAIILVGTFVFLYQKSKPKVITYETVRPEMTDLQKTTVATANVKHKRNRTESLTIRLTPTEKEMLQSRAKSKQI